jgi:hypothetical protein
VFTQHPLSIRSRTTSKYQSRSYGNHSKEEEEEEEENKTIEHKRKNLFDSSSMQEQGLYHHLDFVHLFELHYPKEI